MIEHGEPLHQRAVAQFHLDLRVLDGIQIPAVVQRDTTRDEIDGFTTEYLTETIQSRMKVVSAEALSVFLRGQVETFISFINQAFPSFLLSVEIETVIRIKEVHELLSDLIIGRALYLHQFIGQQRTNLLGSISITQIVAHLRSNLIEHLICQRRRVFLSLSKMSDGFTNGHISM